MAEDRKISEWEDAEALVDDDSLPIVQRAQTPANRLLSWAALKSALTATFASSAKPNLTGLQTFSDNDTATAAGLGKGDVYMTDAGVLMVTF